MHRLSPSKATSQRQCTNSCPDVETQRKIQRSLGLVLENAVAALKAGAPATEVVIHAVTALEDCPLFNAGKGAALTIEGDHELEAGLVEAVQARMVRRLV